jgi:ring-1,2-phenylacetyl-CoA epoxidase subunit PaaD
MVNREAVLDVLRTINDPEMPISIVDLGLVEAVRVDSTAQSETGGVRVEIDVLPTFVGCPALHVIEEEVRKRVGALGGVSEVDVQFHFDPPWTPDRISTAGREALGKVGVTVPPESSQPAAEPSCPFCGSSAVQLESPFGPTRCRMIYYCESCRNPFEHMKRVSIPLTDSGDKST